MTKTRVRFENWNFGNWNLFVIWKLEFGISIYDLNGFVWNIGISIIGHCLLFVIWVLEFNHKYQISNKLQAPVLKEITNLKHQISNKHQYSMTETGVCFEHWNFCHWDLFVICYLGFGI